MIIEARWPWPMTFGKPKPLMGWWLKNCQIIFVFVCARYLRPMFAHPSKFG
jgi:hypothetical protein